MKTILDVQGMHCASCAAGITKQLQETKGVTSTHVNFSTNTAIVEHTKAATTKQLLAAVSDAGYKAQVRQQRALGEVHAHKTAKFPHVALWSAAILLIISMGPMIGLPITHGPINALTQAVLATIILVIGRDVFRQGVIGAYNTRKANMDTLVVLGVGVAYLYGLWTVGVWVFSGVLDMQQIYFEVAGLVLAFVILGRYLEEQAKSSTHDVLSSLLSLAPETARLVIDGREKSIPVQEVAVGDTLKVKPGDRVPVDGEVMVGNSRVDESMLTGEPQPNKKGKGDKVFAGTINQNGMFLLKATATGKETALARIVSLVEEAQASQAPIQRLADEISAVFVPVVLVLAALTFVGWLLFAPASVEVPFAFATTATIAVLIIACPCALGLATPTAVTVGMGVAGSRGVLFRDAAALQRAASVRMVVFDKTGTLTLGKPQVQYIKTYNLSEKVVFRYAASLESASNHPLADALVSFADKNKISYGDPRAFKEFEGRGVVGKVEGRKIVVGNIELFKEQEIGLYDARERIQELSKKQLSPVLVAVEGKLAAVIGVADPIKDSSQDAVAALHAMGVETVMLTGDRQEVAQVIAQELGIGVVRAQLLPEQKLEEIRRLKRKRPLAMVGDGINDAPALAEADVGIALGSGTDIAMQAADIVLVGEEVTGVGRSLHVARQSMRTIKQNLAWAFSYNVLAIPLAAGILYPFTGWLLNPAIAGAAMALSSLSVVLNSLRLKKI